MPQFTDRERIVRLEEWRLGVDKKLDDILDEVRKNGNGGGFTLRGVDTKWVIIGLLVWLAPDAAAYLLRS